MDEKGGELWLKKCILSEREVQSTIKPDARAYICP